MKKLTNTLKTLLIITGLYLTNPIKAQDIVDLTTQVVPPYSSSISEYSTKTLITLRNTTSRMVELTLTGTLTGNGITLNFQPRNPPFIILTSQQVMQVTSGTLQTYFNENAVSATGITLDELYRGAGLPPGTYEMCWQAVGLNGSPLSMPPPNGCGNFTIEETASENAVNLITQVIPPYSTYLSDYARQTNKLLVILQNTSGSSLRIKLAGALIGDNGVSLQIPESFTPSKPIILSTRQTLNLSGPDLREYLDPNVMQLTGIDKNQLIRGAGLPEGSYQWCWQAFDYQTGRPLSQPPPSGCSMFQLQRLEPPMIIQPTCDSQVSSFKPQNLLFTWTVPAGVRPDQVEYVLKIVEVFPETVDPNQAMQAANQPPFFEKTVATNSYLYSLADPILEEGKTYAFRVSARANRAAGSAPLNFRNNGHSEVCTFEYGRKRSKDDLVVHELTDTGQQDPRVVKIDPSDVLAQPPQPNTPPPDMEDSPDCIASCDAPEPANTSQKNVGPGDEVQVGKFTMQVTTGNNTSGTGEILVNFLNTPVKVQFGDLQVNTDNQAFGASVITAAADLAIPQNHPVLSQGMDNPGFNDQVMEAVLDAVESNNRKTSFFNENNPAIGLPFSMDQGAFDLTVVGIIFTPTGATLNAITGVGLNESTTANNYLSLSGSVCLRPNGFGEAGQLVLMSDKSVPLSNKASLVFNQNATNASFDCDGIAEIAVSGEMVFERSALLPVQNNGDVIPGQTKVAAGFNTVVDDYSDWTFELGQLSHPFTIPELVGFRFNASSIVLDHSEVKTPQGIGQNALWQGLYIGAIELTLPDLFEKNGSPLVIEAEDLRLDKTGFSADIDPDQILLSLNEGKIGSWPVSLEQFGLTIEESALNGVNIGGKLKLPIASNELTYDVAVTASENENEPVDFQFNIQQANTLSVDMWFAQIDLEPSSTIGVQKVGNNYRPTADLSGSISLGWNENSANKPGGSNKVSSIDIPTLDFEHLTIQDNGGNVPDIDLQFAALANTNGLNLKLSGFNIDLAPPGFVKQGNTIGLQLSVDLTLIEMANSLSGGTTFTIFADYQDGSFQYKETQLNTITIDGDIGVAKLDGTIDIYDQDPTFGNGFRGMISVIINALGGAGIEATLQIGSVDGFKYWYFDVMADLGVAGLNIPGTMASIYGMGGGAYYNMQRGETPVQTIDELNQVPAYSEQPGANKDGLVFTPSEGVYGFSAAVAFGLSGVRSAFNGDLKFSMEVSQSGAVNHVTLEGGCYLMQNIDDRDGGLITGTLYSEIQPRIPDATNAQNAAMNRPSFKLNAGMSMDIANGLVSGQATLDIWFSPSEWWIKLGEWTNEDEPWNDESRMQLAVDLKIIKPTFHSYFMMGSAIPDAPQMPLLVRQAFAEDVSQSINYNTRQHLMTATSPEQVQGNPGLAFGAGFHNEADLKFLVFYADLEFFQGFDVVLRHFETSPCGGSIGINGWYAQGKAYAYLSFDVGVELDIWVWQGKASILKATAAAALQAALPNPVWMKGQFAVHGEILNGLFEFNTKFRFEFGEKCEATDSGPFGEMPIVSDVIPADKETNVHVYTVPEIAFNFPKGIFSYEEEVDGELVEKEYRYIFKSFKFTYKDPETNANKIIDLTGHIKYRGDGYSATFYYPEFILPEHTWINYTIFVEGWKMSGGAEKVHEETVTGSFKSGSWPNKIDPDFVVSGTPNWRQNFFLKNEYAQGHLRFKYNLSHLTNKQWWYEQVFKLGNYSGFGSGTFQFGVRFKELETNQEYTTTFEMASPTKMVFDIPNGLKNNKIYDMQLYLTFTPPINAFAANPSNVQHTYEDVLITAQEGGGGILTAQNLAVQMQDQQGPNADNGQHMVTEVVHSGKQQNNQAVLANNYQALAQTNHQFSPGNIAAITPDENPNPGIGDVLVFQPTDPNKTYIQRRRNELLKAEKGTRGIEWDLLDNFNWHFKTSRFNTLSEKLNSMQVDEVITHEYSGLYEKFNDGDALHEPEFGEGGQVNITTKVPVVLIEIEEMFEYWYDIKGYSVAVNDNNSIDVPPLCGVMQSENNTWFANGFLGGPDNMYHLPDADDWAKMDYYSDEDGMYVGKYIQDVPGKTPFPFPGSYWENFIPDYASSQHWPEDRLSGGNKAKPFGNKDYPDHYQMSAYPPFALQEFYKNSSKHGDINFGNKQVVWFKTTMLATDAIQNAAEKGEENEPGGQGGGVGFQGSMNLQGNVYGQVNTQYGGFDDIATISHTYMAVIDYTEWVAMRDFYLLRKFIYERNEEEEGTFFYDGCEILKDNTTTNCFYPAIKNWVNNILYYKGRPGGQFSIKFGNDNTNKHFYYDVNKLN